MTTRTSFFTVFMILAIRCGCAFAVPQEPLAPPPHVRVDFEKEIRPILSRSCMACHNEKKKRGGLDLSTKNGAARGGSISAEHGIGQLERDELERTKAPLELAIMRRIKAALDPAGILNPGKIF